MANRTLESIRGMYCTELRSLVAARSFSCYVSLMFVVCNCSISSNSMRLPVKNLGAFGVADCWPEFWWTFIRNQHTVKIRSK